MITNKELNSLWIDESGNATPYVTKEISEARLKKRLVYSSSEEGIKQLATILKNGFLFSKIDPDYPAEAGAHNLVVELCDSMGLFDEENIYLIAKFLLTLPLFPLPPDDIDRMLYERKQEELNKDNGGY